jgi:hypothetical protein
MVVVVEYSDLLIRLQAIHLAQYRLVSQELFLFFATRRKLEVAQKVLWLDNATFPDFYRSHWVTMAPSEAERRFVS